MINNGLTLDVKAPLACDIWRSNPKTKLNLQGVAVENVKNETAGSKWC